MRLKVISCFCLKLKKNVRIEFFLDANHQQVIRSRTKSLPPQKVTLENDSSSSDDEEMFSVNLKNDNSRLSRLEKNQKSAVRSERSSSENRGFKEGVSKSFNNDNFIIFSLN